MRRAAPVDKVPVVAESRLAIWISATRPRTLSAATAPVLVGSALAAQAGHFNLWAAMLCLSFALLMQIGANFANDYYDFLRGADSAARVGPRRAVAAGLVSPDAMRRAMLAVFAAGFLVGLGLLARGGPWMLALGLASIAGGIGYTGGPWPLAYLGLGDLFVFVFFGLIAVGGTYFIQAGDLTTQVIVAAIPVGLLAANILVVNNYRDVETDTAANKRTLVVRWGRRAARGQFNGSLVVAFLIPLVLAVHFSHFGWLLPLLLVPWAWRQARRLRESQTPAELIALLGATGKLLASYAALLAAGLLL